MDHLWAPWRSHYVSSGQENRSEIFSNIARSTDDDQHFVLWRGKTCFTLLNAFPYNTGHLMAIPYRRISDIDELTEEETIELFGALRRMKAALATCFHPGGFNIGINLGTVAGAGIVAHLHVHLVPRWEGDSNFMTVTASTRVHPSDLATVYQKLKAALAQLPPA